MSKDIYSYECFGIDTADQCIRKCQDKYTVMNSAHRIICRVIYRPSRQ